MVAIVTHSLQRLPLSQRPGDARGSLGNVGGQALRGENGVPIAHRLEESFVLGERDFRRIYLFERHGVHGEEEDSLDVGTKAGEEVLEPAIAGRGAQGGVEFDVELELASNVAFVIGLAHADDD